MRISGARRKSALPLFSLVAFAIAVAVTPNVFAGDVVSVFDVRKSLPLDPTEAVYHDYYLNAGPEAGLKKGMYVSIVRKTPVHDPVQNKAQATLSIEVARVQIIHVERNIAVARIAQEFSADDRPVVEYGSVMIGDTVDLSTVSMDPPKERRKTRKPGSETASAAPAERTNEPAPPASPAAPAPASPQPTADKAPVSPPPAVKEQQQPQVNT